MLIFIVTLNQAADKLGIPRSNLAAMGAVRALLSRSMWRERARTQLSVTIVTARQ
jgi:hypothetical protein